MLLDLGAGKSIAARTSADDMDALRGLPVIGTHMRPNAELITALKPDLILQMAGRQEAAMQTENLRELGFPVLTFDVHSFQQLFQLMGNLGKLTGKEQEAAALIANWRQRLENLNSPPDRKPRVYYEARQPQLLAAGAKSMVNDIITAAGGENIMQLPKKLARLNEEALLLARPEICLLQKGPMSPEPVPLAERPNLRSLPCVKNNMTFIISEQEFARPGPRSVTAAEKLAGIIKKARELH